LLMKKAHGTNRIAEEQTHLRILYKNDTKRRIQEALCKYFKKMLYRPTPFLSITEHIFHCIPHFFCQILSFIHAFVLHMNGLKCTNADNIRPYTVVNQMDFNKHNLAIFIHGYNMCAP